MNRVESTVALYRTLSAMLEELIDAEIDNNLRRLLATIYLLRVAGGDILARPASVRTQELADCIMGQAVAHALEIGGALADIEALELRWEELITEWRETSRIPPLPARKVTN